jgi:hypothetical protein
MVCVRLAPFLHVNSYFTVGLEYRWSVIVADHAVRVMPFMT